MFWAQQNLGSTKKFGKHCPRMPSVATGLGVYKVYIWLY